MPGTDAVEFLGNSLGRTRAPGDSQIYSVRIPSRTVVPGTDAVEFLGQHAPENSQIHSVRIPSRTAVLGTDAVEFPQGDRAVTKS